MNFIKVSILATALSVWLPTVQAEEVASLPTIKVMADSELRQEAVGVTPYQENKAVRRALQHQVIKKRTKFKTIVLAIISVYWIFSLKRLNLILIKFLQHYSENMC